MFKKLILSMVALLLSLSASAETTELWHSENDDGVLVDWGKAAFALTPEQAAAEVNIGDTFTITVAGVTEGGWPQVCIFSDQQGGFGSILANAGVGGKEYPYEVSFSIIGAYIDKIHENGLSFGGSGAYVKSVSKTPAPFEVSRDAVWFGPKTCGYGNGVSISKDIFADVTPGDKIQVFYEKEAAEHTLQFLFGGWSGANIPTYGFWQYSSFTTDEEVGCHIIELTEDLYKLTQEVTEGEGDNKTTVTKEYDVFALLKENGLIMHGPCTVKQVLYIPKPVEPEPADPLELNASWWHEWDGYGENANIANQTPNVDNKIGESVSPGSTVLGAAGVEGKFYADLTEYKGIEAEGTAGVSLRLLFNRPDMGGGSAPITECNPKFDTNGKLTFLFSEVSSQENGNEGGPYPYVHLNSIKVPWSFPEGISACTVTSLRLIPKPDPIVEAKEALADEITLAKLYDSFAKTEDSFAVLQNSITASETALNALDATVETLNAASKSIQDAIDGLTLQDGYAHLTAEMFKSYASVDNPGEGTPAGCAYDLFKLTGMPYGDGSVGYLNWADLSGYDKLIVTTDGINGKPRFCMNRTSADGQENNGGMLDIAPGNGNSSTANYLTSDGNVFTVDLKKMVTDYGYARLHSMKNFAGNVLVTGMYLYTSNDELELPLEDLSKEIEKAEHCDRYLKTEESLQILDAAIAEGKAKLEEKKPTVESVEAATQKITDAIGALKFQPGYSELTKEMFKHYASVEEPGEGSAANGNFKLFESVSVPFGTDGVSHLEWAELTDYDQLIVKTDGNGGNPRFLMNRLVDGGQQAPTMEASNMLDITFGEDTWSAKEYAGCEDNVYSIDLNKIIDDYGFARLNTIKSRNGGIYVTGMYLYKDPEAATEYALNFDIDDPAHVVIKVNDEEVGDLKDGLKVADRAKLVIAPAESFILKSVIANDEEATLKEGCLTKTIVKAYNFVITTDDADPLAKPKKALTAVLESAKLYDSFAKTEESFAALTNAIEAAEAALSAEDATEESLNTAGANITKAIEGLTLEEGYSYLTPDMFKLYASVENPGEGEKTECAYELFNTSRMLYGDINNDNLKWADLSDFDQLVLTTLENSTRPRFCMNNEASAKFEINPYDGTNEATEAYQTVEDNRYTIDLKKIVNDHSIAHLHSIEVNDWGTGIFVTGMYLYKDPNRLDGPKQELSEAIANAELCDDFLITEESWKALQAAVEEGKAKLDEENPSLKSIEEMTKKVNDAIDGLTLQAGYSDLKVAEYKNHASVEEPGEGTAIDHAYVLNEVVNTPYGDTGVSELNWADLTAYDKLIVRQGDDKTARVLINRMVHEGNDADSKEVSQMLDMLPGSERWSTKEYAEFDSENNIFTVDLKKIVDDYGFARLNAIKYPWSEEGVANGTVKGMYLYKDPEAAKEFVLGFDIDNPSHVVINVNGTQLNDLTAGANEVNVADRARLSIAPAAGYVFTSLTADGEDVMTDGTYTKTIVKAISYKMTTKVDDPLEEYKTALQATLDNARLYDSFAKTEESFAALQAAIEDADAALTSTDATPESLTAANEDIAKAIEALELTEGYAYLTDDIFKSYASVEEPGEGEETGCAFELFTAVNTLYGDGNVSEKNWADLADYDKLILTLADTQKPRVMMNRMIAGGSDADTKEDSKMLELQPGKGNWSTNDYTTYDSEKNIFTVNVKKILTDYGFARLNAIKYPYGVSGMVTGMYLYTSTDDLEQPLEDLANAISKAEACDDFLKTEASWNALQTAIEEGKAKLVEIRPAVETIEAATKKITEAIDGLTLQDGYSELTKDMFRRYADVNNPGEGESFAYNFKLGELCEQPLGGGNISELEWADLTNYDKLIFKLKEGDLRVLMNRQEFGAQQGANKEDSKMIDIKFWEDSWSKDAYTSTEDNIYYIDLRSIVDDYGLARLHAVKSSCNITGIYLYKDAADADGYKLTFSIDDPAHVVIEENGEEIKGLKAGDNEVTVADRAKLSISPAAKFRLKSVTADGEEVVLPEEGAFSKVIVKAISYNIATEDADPLEKPRIELSAVIANGERYDGVAKTEESFKALTDAIEAAKPLMTEATTPSAITDAILAIRDAIEGLELAENYTSLTKDMFKKYASVSDPGDGEATDCASAVFEASLMPYGDRQNGYLNWADLSDYDRLIVTVNGSVGPRFYMNRLEENGAQSATMEESKMIDIKASASDSWSGKYLTVAGNKYTVDLKEIVKDFDFARLHSIQPDGYEQTAFITGMYLYKEPYVDVTGVSLNAVKIELTAGESCTLTAAVSPDNATDKTVEWTSDNEEVAAVDADGNVTATGVGKATITASCGGFSAKCLIKSYPTPGDATWNGAIEITDAVDITNYVVKKKTADEGWDEDEWKEFYVRGANANGDEDGMITFADASATVSLILAQSASASAQSRISGLFDESADALVIGRASEASGSRFTVRLDNAEEYVALQADITVPEGMNAEVKAGRRIAGSHTLETRRLDDTHIRIVIFNLRNSAFADNDAPIFEIVSDSNIWDSDDLVITRILASDADANGYVLAAKTAQSTGVAPLGLDDNAPVKVYDVNGIYVGDTLEGLLQGTYIVRQGDVAKKVRIR